MVIQGLTFLKLFFNLDGGPEEFEKGQKRADYLERFQAP